MNPKDYPTPIVVGQPTAAQPTLLQKTATSVCFSIYRASIATGQGILL